MPDIRGRGIKCSFAHTICELSANPATRSITRCEHVSTVHQACIRGIEYITWKVGTLPSNKGSKMGCRNEHVWAYGLRIRRRMGELWAGMELDRSDLNKWEVDWESSPAGPQLSDRLRARWGKGNRAVRRLCSWMGHLAWGRWLTGWGRRRSNGGWWRRHRRCRTVCPGSGFGHIGRCCPRNLGRSRDLLSNELADQWIIHMDHAWRKDRLRTAALSSGLARRLRGLKLDRLGLYHLGRVGWLSLDYLGLQGPRFGVCFLGSLLV